MSEHETERDEHEAERSRPEPEEPEGVVRPRWRPASEPTCCGSSCDDCPF